MKVAVLSSIAWRTPPRKYGPWEQVGTPVIAFNRGSMSELIIDGKTGFLVNDIADALKAIKKVDQIIPNTCREHACTNLSIQKMTDEYINAYNLVLHK